MKIKTPIEFQTFNDGICSIYSVQNVADPGNVPVEQLAEKYKRVPYERRKVGLTRYWQAAQADVLVSDLIRIQRQMRISTNDICVIENVQYQIKQVQDVKDTLPPSTDLTLERLEVAYDIRPIS